MKPRAEIIGADGNVFATMSIASNALVKAGMRSEANKLRERVITANSYDQALQIILEYVEPVAVKGYYDEDADEEWDEYWNEVDSENE